MVISFIRAVFLYVTIVFAIKLMGKRQISELQTTELVITLLISDVASIPMQNTAQPLLSGLIPMVVLVSCELIASCLMIKSSRFRKIVCGKPVIIINDGKLDQIQMRRLRLTVDDVCEQLRQLDVFNLQDVAYAIMETNGKISVLKKPENRTPDTSMLGVVPPDTGLDTVVINDGEISDFSLFLCGLSRDWLYGVLQGKGLNVKDVFIMTANKSKEYCIIEKEV